MTVSFDGIPNTLRIPSFSVEINNSNAEQGPSVLQYQGLVYGQKTADGTGTANTFYLCTSANQAKTIGGRGSMIARMAEAWFAGNKSTPMYLCVLADNPAGVAATGSLTVTGTATSDGTINLYLGGRSCQVAVANGDSPTTIAAAIATAIGKHSSGTVTFAAAQAADNVVIGATTFVGTTGAVTPGAATYSIDSSNNAAAASLVTQVNAHAVASLLVTASALSAVVTLKAQASGSAGDSIVLTSTNGTRVAVSGAGTLTGSSPAQDYAVHATPAAGVVATTFKNKGLVGNEFDMRLNYQVGEVLPSGVSVAVSPLTGGTSNPVLTSALAALGDAWRQIWANPYTDATSLTAIENELADRFGPARMIDGLAITAKLGTLSTLTTLGSTRNSKSSCILPTNVSPTPPDEYAACAASIVAKYAQQDPARPLQTLALAWVKAPAELDRFTNEERDLLLHDGIATTKVGAGGVVQLDRLITTWQTNAAGAPDTSYLDATTLLTLMYLRYDVCNHFATKFPRCKLANDGTRAAPGQALVTPKILKAEFVLWFSEMEELGLVEGIDQFKRDLIVERNVSDPNRVDALLPPDLINMLIVTAMSLQFRL